MSEPSGNGTVVLEPVAPTPKRQRTTLNGIRTVAQHEFRVRLRSGRWRWMLGAWFTVLALFTVLMDRAVDATYDPDLQDPGVPVFGGLVLALLGLSLLVVPALTAQTVNGDRERGVLATLQVTLLTPAEIALGKLAAAWAVSLVFLAAAVPMVAATMAMGGPGLDRVLPTMLVLAVLLGVVAAIAQCLSSLLSRTMTSAVLSYAAVFALTVGTLITFALALPTTQETVQRTYTYPAIDSNGEEIPGQTRSESYQETRTREDKVWWLLGANPFVILADAAPEAGPRYHPVTRQRLDDPMDPLAEIRSAVRDVRTPPSDEDRRVVPGAGTAAGEAFDSNLHLEFAADDRRPVWPYGLAFNAALGLGAVAITIRRLRTPATKLPRGVRVA